MPLLPEEESGSDEGEDVGVALRPFGAGNQATVSKLSKRAERELRGAHSIGVAEKAGAESRGAQVLLQLAEEWEETDDDDDDDMVVEGGQVHALSGLEAARHKQRTLG